MRRRLVQEQPVQTEAPHGDPMAETQDSIEHTYRRYFALIRGKCTRVLGDTSEAEDVAQETFTRLWWHRHPGKRPPVSNSTGACARSMRCMV